MNLHEYQAKALFERYDLPVPAGKVASSLEEARQEWKHLGTDIAVVKAQVYAGGRGKAGGVRLISDAAEFDAYVDSLLGSRLVTIQTDEHGQPVNSVLVAAPTDIAKELYLSLVIDRAAQRIVVMASTEGGVDIEAVAVETPEKILRAFIDPLVGVMPYQCRELGFKLGFEGKQIKQFTHILTALGKLFVENDLSQAEINPLVIQENGDLLCLDAKVALDDNALFRHPELAAMRDLSQEDARENRAQEAELNYIALHGDIGCMVNGAGLAMATMDLIKLKGGNPANFLDVGGGATKERVTEAFKIILSDSNVKAVLVNIFGGIVRCDVIAEGILGAVAEVGIEVPVVVRLEGNNAEIGAQMLEESDLNIIAAKGFTEAAEKVVACVRGEQ